MNIFQLFFFLDFTISLNNEQTFWQKTLYFSDSVKTSKSIFSHSGIWKRSELV